MLTVFVTSYLHNWVTKYAVLSQRMVSGQTQLTLSGISSEVLVFENKYSKGLILAQNERWRRGLGMQVEGEPARGTPANGVGSRR